MSFSAYRPVKVSEVEISCSLNDLTGLEGYEKVQLLVRAHGTPLGELTLPIFNGRCPATLIVDGIVQQFGEAAAAMLLRDPLQKGLFAMGGGDRPLVTVAVCTHERTADLEACLAAITQSDYSNLEILVIDNAPRSDATQRLIEQKFPAVRYVREDRPGLSWARNRAIDEARGEIVAFTDDDVLVDPTWVSAISRPFQENGEVMVVTGLVLAHELETEAQRLFEINGGFGRGFHRKEVFREPRKRLRWYQLGTGQYGTGANMAFRRRAFAQLGLFDTALGAGTPTGGGEDWKSSSACCKRAAR